MDKKWIMIGQLSDSNDIKTVMTSKKIPIIQDVVFRYQYTTVHSVTWTHDYTQSLSALPLV